MILTIICLSFLVPPSHVCLPVPLRPTGSDTPWFFPVSSLTVNTHWLRSFLVLPHLFPAHWYTTIQIIPGTSLSIPTDSDPLPLAPRAQIPVPSYFIPLHWHPVNQILPCSSISSLPILTPWIRFFLIPSCLYLLTLNDSALGNSTDVNQRNDSAWRGRRQMTGVFVSVTGGCVR